MKASVYCPTCNGVMTQYVGFNEREPKPGTPFECVKGCATPTLQKSAQQTQSQPATSAKAPTLPVWTPNTAKSLAQRSVSAGSWKLGLPDPDPDTSSLRTHQPQGGSHPARSGKTIQQLTDKVRALSEQPVDPERFWNKQYLESVYKQQLSFLVDDLFVRMTTPRILIPKPGREMSTYTEANRSPDQTSAPATDPSCPPKDWTSD